MKNLLMKHKRKIGVIFMSFALAFLLMPTTFVFAKNRCHSSSSTFITNAKSIIREEFTLTLETTNGSNNDFKITMSPRSDITDESKKTAYCQQTFTLTQINGTAYTGGDNTLSCSHPVTFHTDSLDGETTSGLTGVVVTLVGKDVGKNFDLIREEGSSEYCYIDSVTINLQKTVGTEFPHIPGCPTYELSSTTTEVLGNAIDCTSPSGDFQVAFCRVKEAAQAAGNDKSSELDSNGKFSAASTNSFKCNYDLGGSNPIPSAQEIEEAEGDDYFVGKNYLYAAYEYEVNNGKYQYEYSPGNVKEGEAITCKIKCEEAVEVEYGPPVATKAGACFEYKVRVTSRVSCNMSELPPDPGPTECSYCDPYPTCYGYGQIWEQGGPNDDFDQCIRACDGGKYSKACSKKCYKSIYGSSVSAGAKVNSDILDLTATKLDNASDVTSKSSELNSCKSNPASYLGSNYSSGIGSKLIECMCIGKIYGNSSDESYKYGCYFKDGAISWEGSKDTTSRDTCSSNCAGIEGRWYTYNDGKYHWGGYILPKNLHDGFWRQVKSDTSAGYCDDVCSWSGCDGDRYLNDGYSQKDYLENSEKREKAIQTCQSKAVCTTTQSEYTITAKYTNKKDQTTDYKFPYSTGQDSIQPQSGGGVSGTFDQPGTTILTNYPTDGKGRQGCYNQDDSDTDLYRSTWGFPGSWRNIKTAEISYDPSNNTKAWREIPNKFCVPVDSKGVNVEWWNQYEARYIADSGTPVESLTKEDNDCVKPGTAANTTSYYPTTNIDVWNIIANTNKFGYFEWNIQIECFYATNPAPSYYANDGDNSDDVPDKCIGGERAYTVRTVDLTNVFPSNDPSASPDASREPGFNWTEYATVDGDHNSGYQSQPDEYLKQIQEQAKQAKASGTDYYNEDKLDYQFTLSAQELRDLRQKSKQAASYGNYEDTNFYVDGNGISRYYSSLIHNDATLKNKKVPQTEALECNNMINYLRTDCDTVHGV